jgi:hypothetical protein
MDFIAWSIVVIFYLTCVMPLIGDAMVGRITAYVEAVKIGAMMHAVLIGFASVLFSVVWAWLRLTT